MRILAVSVAALALSGGIAAAQAPGPRDGDRLERREQRQEERFERRQESRQDNRGRGDRFEDRSRERIDRRVIVRDRDRGPNVIVRERYPSVRYGVGPDVYIRTLPLQYRTVIYGGRQCRITVTRRVRANGRIVTTETRKCPGRPAVVIRTRR